ncbi:sugar phosphate isomerase/epimerase family protein [Oceanobacillus longus]|uniref:Sugar phosphate isomerase/epimerase family protein n=1 Tax=Oceanobacillus longus TaxID=930120 RepID=A0ABV8H0F1_9BACI
MFKIGLCSVTFRNLPVEEVIRAAKEAEIQGIEWGGDIHVPPGNLEQAETVAALTEDAGMEVTSYGSYYRLGETEDASFETILQTAVKLKAPSIRVWAGRKGSNEVTETDWRTIVEDARRIGDLSKERDIQINLEYHGRTLTDTVQSATRLMKEINHENISLYWQPALFETVEERKNSINQIKPWLTHVHVFHWKIIDGSRIVYSFSEGTNDWKGYLAELEKDDGVRYLMIEFVKGDRVEQFWDDVGVLKGLMNE